MMSTACNELSTYTVDYNLGYYHLFGYKSGSFLTANSIVDTQPGLDKLYGFFGFETNTFVNDPTNIANVLTYKLNIKDSGHTFFSLIQELSLYYRIPYDIFTGIQHVLEAIYEVKLPSITTIGDHSKPVLPISYLAGIDQSNQINDAVLLHTDYVPKDMNATHTDCNFLSKLPTAKDALTEFSFYTPVEGSGVALYKVNALYDALDERGSTEHETSVRKVETLHPTKLYY